MEQEPLYLDFEPLGKRVEARPGVSLLETARSAGIALVAVCGGKGTCGQCRVQTMRGAYSPVTAAEQRVFSAAELAAGWRLACQVVPLSAGKVHVPPDSLSTPQRLQVEGLEPEEAVVSAHRVFDLTLDEPALTDLRADGTRLSAALAAGGEPVSIPFDLLDPLSTLLREQRWRVRVVRRGDEVIGLLPVGQTPLGLAVDVGTTKLAAYLLDLSSGQVVARGSAMNPQIHYGEDVISRINYCMEHVDGRAVLRDCLVEALQGLAVEMCAGLSAEPRQILEAVLVGNTAMHHLAAGLPVTQLALSPFVPAVSEPVSFPAREIGLNLAPAARVYMPANIAGYVGADHVAMLLATRADQAEDTLLAIDIGTNTEISLVSGGQITCCSCASGPAFEGAHIHEGMRAAAGAIERVRIEDGAVQIATIANQPPIGICGSGILDAVAEMARAGLLNEHGALGSGSPLVRGSGKDAEFVLAEAARSGCGRDLTVNRRDVYEIMLAKAAIQTGIDLLLDTAGLEKAQIDRVVVAGAFGTYIDLKSAIQIGLLPDLPLERFHQVGNAAGAGARLLLRSDQERRRAADFAARMRYLELTTHPRFNEVFVNTLRFRK